ncbi:Vps5-domain-containing protein [Obba rivulosa]|uniref:Vps5-domain-containing protein n=1 Tax=Obba rivulosa TaxID=1052685 RepID=A0A8E2APB8_9APHY|nr:Vps5-domain-containing protein [Obba rivulosa]
MSGFDDLLSSSRNVLDNPFEDPFARPRSSSPDPWASFSVASTAQPTLHDDDAGFGPRSTTPTLETHSFADSHGFHALSESAVDSPSEQDPHAEAELTAPPSPPGSALRSPGFRESISTADEERPTAQPEPLPAREPSPPLRPPSPALSVQLARRAAAPEPSGRASRASTASLASSSRPERAIRSPLDQPLAADLTRSIAGLSLGGESLGGWQGAESTFVTAPRERSVSRDRSDSDDDDDDRPILETVRQPAVKPPPAPRTDGGIQPTFVITVDDPQRVGDPIRAYTMYTVHTRTTSPLYSKSSFSVLRRYSDFLWLYETLSLNNPGVVVPPVPEKKPVGRFDANFVQQRRLALEKCIQKIVNHPVLQKDPDLKLFLESDTFALDIKHRKAEIAHEKGGLMASIGQSVIGPRYYESDEWFDRQKAYLDSLESQLRGLVKAIDTVSKHRSDVATAAGEFAQTISDLASSDVGEQLSSSLTGVAEVERKAQELQNAQAQEDTITILSTADEYARLINSVRMAFSSRIRTYHAWQQADGQARRAKQQHETSRSQGKLTADQIPRSLAQVAEAERRALEAKAEFEQVSRLVKTEVARFEQERIEDFKASLEAFLEGMITRQKQLIATWENYQQMLLKRVNPPAQRTSGESAVAVS